MKKFLPIAVVLFVVAFCIIGYHKGNAADDENKYGILPELYEMYVKADKNYNKEWVLAYSDTMFQRADELGDVKAQCLALKIPVDYYNSQPSPDLEKIRESVENLKNFVLETPYTEFLFDCWGKLINRLITEHRYTAANAELEKFQLKAFELNDTYGISSAFGHLGAFYSVTGIPDAAINSYKQGLEYSETYGTQADTYNWYRRIGDEYIRLEQTDSAEYYLRMAEENPEMTPNLRQDLAVSLMQLALQKGDTTEARKRINRLKELDAQGKLRQYAKKNLANAEVDMLINQGRYEEALDYASRTRGTDMLQRLSGIYALMGDYKAAFDSLESYRLKVQEMRRDAVLRTAGHNDSIFRSNTAIAEKRNLMIQKAQEQLRREKAENEAQARRMEAERAIHERQVAETQRAKAEMERARAELTKSQAEAQRKAIEVENHRVMLAKAKVEQEKKEAQMQADRESLRAAEAFNNQMKAEKQREEIIFITIGCLLLLGLAFAMYSIITRNKHERELRVERDAAIKANSTKDAVIQNMRHEIRTPLNAITGFTQLIVNAEEYGVTKAEIDEYGILIMSNSELLTSILDELLYLTDADAGKQGALELKRVDAVEIALTAMKSCQMRLQPGVKFVNHLPQTPLMIKSDSNQLTQVFNNLIVNACKYTATGTITIDAHREGKMAVFRVSDTGPGIPAQKAEAVFERFEKLGSHVQGMGLGLNVCRDIITKLGGSIYVDTKYTGGARLVFTHPLP